MENVLKGLPDKIRDQLSRHHTQNKSTSNVHIFLITGDELGVPVYLKRCRAVLQRLTPAHKVFRDKMTKKCMEFHVSSPKQTKCNTSELLASFPK